MSVIFFKAESKIISGVFWGQSHNDYRISAEEYLPEKGIDQLLVPSSNKAGHEQPVDVVGPLSVNEKISGLYCNAHGQKY